MLVCLILAAIIGFTASRLMLSESGSRVIVRQAGKTIAAYPLNQDQILNLESDLGKNKVVIKNGQVFMESADCRDQYCVKHRPISANNDSIICLPHKLVIEVVKENKDQEVDSVAN